MNSLSQEAPGIKRSLRCVSLGGCGRIASAAKDARWTEPELVAEFDFSTWTRDGRVRHPSFKGLREDKPARAVKREVPKR